MRPSLRALADPLVPRALRRDPEQARAGRRLLGFTAMSWVVVPVFAAPSLATPASRAYGLMVLGWGLAVLPTPLVMWLTGRIAPAAHWFVAAAWCSLSFETLRFGGLQAPSTYYLPLLPGLAILLAGRRAALPWVAASAATVVTATVGDGLGVMPGRPFSEGVSSLIAGATLLIGTALATGLCSLYESQKREALARLAEERERFAWHATHDPLTGLPNRVLLGDRLATALARARRQGARVALVYLDVDGFKAVNDRLGHAAGDALLCDLAARLQREVRASDTLARLGGDEFAVVMEGMRTRADAERVAEALRRAALGARPGGGQGPAVEVSAGVALFPDDAGDGEELLKASDAAMYREKRAEGPTNPG